MSGTYGASLPGPLAQATSVYGSVLKIDSTKKVCKKLQRLAADTANWDTNVRNERGKVVISVLTESESTDSLQKDRKGPTRNHHISCIPTGNAAASMVPVDHGTICGYGSSVDCLWCFRTVPPDQLPECRLLLWRTWLRPGGWSLQLFVKF